MASINITRKLTSVPLYFSSHTKAHTYTDPYIYRSTTSARGMEGRDWECGNGDRRGKMVVETLRERNSGERKKIR